MMKTAWIALKALLVMTASFYLWGWTAWTVRSWDARLGFELPGWTFVPGVALIVLGGALAFTCVGLFVVRGRGTLAPFDPPRKFVAAGPYRIVRNPMYVGVATVLIGLGFMLHSASILLLSFAFLTLAHLFVVLYEEPALRHKFGTVYENYCRSVSRWLPILLFAVTAAWGAESKPDFSGEWKLNQAKSTYAPLPAPEDRIDRIEHKDPNLKISRKQIRQRGEPTAELECVLDGSDCTVTITGVPLEMKTTARWYEDKLVFESAGIFNGQQVTIRETWTLDPGGKSITIQRSLSSIEGMAHQSIVLEKQ